MVVDGLRCVDIVVERMLVRRQQVVVMVLLLLEWRVVVETLVRVLDGLQHLACLLAVYSLAYEQPTISTMR